MATSQSIQLWSSTSSPSPDFAGECTTLISAFINLNNNELIFFRFFFFFSGLYLLVSCVAAAKSTFTLGVAAFFASARAADWKRDDFCTYFACREQN